LTKSRIFWPGVLALVCGAGAVLFGGATRGTFALYNGEVQNAGSTFAGGWIGTPAAPTAVASGNNVNLAWTPGTHGPVTGQQLWGVDNNTSSNCTGAAYASLATMASASTASFTDSARGTAANGGHWFCYKLVSTSATVWTGETVLPALQLGLAATAVSFANASSTCFGAATPATGKIDCNDRITITFNQRVVASGSPVAVCVFNTGTIVLGDSNTTKCTSSSNPNTIGTLSGATISANASYTSSTVATSTTAPWTMTITLGPARTPPTVSGTFTYNPSTTIKSFATTNQATICTTSNTTCRPAAASGF
jgi:hypothetical protein